MKWTKDIGRPSFKDVTGKKRHGGTNRSRVTRFLLSTKFTRFTVVVDVASHREPIEAGLNLAVSFSKTKVTREIVVVAVRKNHRPKGDRNNETPGVIESRAL
jgi:hypothetical protein